VCEVFSHSTLARVLSDFAFAFRNLLQYKASLKVYFFYLYPLLGTILLRVFWCDGSIHKLYIEGRHPAEIQTFMLGVVSNGIHVFWICRAHTIEYNALTEGHTMYVLARD